MPDTRKRSKFWDVNCFFTVWLGKLIFSVIYIVGTLAAFIYIKDITSEFYFTDNDKSERYWFDEYDDDVREYVIFKVNKKIDRLESFDVIDLLNKEQAYKNQQKNVDNPIKRWFLYDSSNKK